MQKINEDPNAHGASLDEKALELVREVKEETAKYRKQFEPAWKEYEDFYYGKHHKTGEDKKTTKNHLFKIIEGEVPILTDSIPGTTILADREDRQDDALILEKSIRYVYNDQNLQLLLPSLVRSSLISAPGILYTFYDPDADNGDGKIKYKKLLWENVYLDGNATTIEDCEKARIEIPMRRDAIARLFPEKKDQILKQEKDQDYKQTDNFDNFEQRDVSDGKGQSGRPDKYSAKDIINYVETWVKSYDLEPIPVEETAEELEKENQQLASGEAPDITKWEDHAEHIKSHFNTRAGLMAQIGLPPEASFDQASMQIDLLMQQNPEFEGTQILLGVKLCDNHIEEHIDLQKLNPTSERPKYKDGFRVIKTVQNVVLYDGPNPDQTGEIPLVLFYCYKDDTIHGFPEAKNIIDAQKTLNDMDYKEFKGLKRCANPGWIVDHESNVKASTLTNDDGIVVVKAKGTEVRRLEAGTISPQLERRMQNDVLAMEDISGVNEATQGRTPSPNASGAAISNLQNQAIGRIRLKDRHLQYYSMKRLGKLTAKLIIANWSTEKRLRLNNDTAGVEELVFDPIKMNDLSYTVEITPGSMAGIDKEALNSFFVNLLSAGHIPFKEFLLVADFPKREILLKGAVEREKLQMQQAEEQEQIQAQQMDLSAQLQQLQQENIKLKSLISPNLLSSEEHKLMEELTRQEAISQLTGNLAAANGQANNQGMINV